MTETGFSLPFFLLLKEDEYETKFGDGYYAYFDGAWRDHSIAEGYAEIGCKKDVALHVKKATLRIEGEKITIEGDFHPHDVFTPAEVVKALILGS